jgi:uncharacterized cupredoxin-like copper-binding protein
MVTELMRRALAATLALVSAVALAHGDAPSGAKPAAVAEQTPFGIAGHPAKATRTVAIDMSDRMRFDPPALSVKRGETVRFVVRNRGALLHEMVIGTPKDLADHAALMRKFPDMEHDAPYMTHVKPGASGDIVWTFNRTGTFQFACLVAGHYEAGMTGRITVK